MIGVELRGPGGPGGPDGSERGGGRLAFETAKAALRRGLLILPSGGYGNVLGLAPPLVITEGQLDTAAGILDASIGEASRGR
jgi:4-aminobutyrate aminotransferase-like enzyme